jgi:hypothetical protein
MRKNQYKRLASFLVVTYLLLVSLTYWLRITDAIIFLNLPWSWVAIVLSYLIFHTVPYGALVVDCLMLSGSVINSVIVFFVAQKLDNYYSK